MSKFRISSICAIIGIIIAIVAKSVFLAFASILLWIVITFIGVISLKSGIFGSSLTRKSRSKSIFLTFDDGPDPVLTPKVLDILKDKDIKASFFLIACKAQKYPELVKRIVEEGHTIGSHDLTHPWWSNFRTTKSLRRDISESVKILESLSGQKINLYRPPVGLSNPQMHSVCRKLNLTITGWSRSARDGGNRFSEAIRHLSAIPLIPGEIVLLHDTAPNLYNRGLLIAALETIISRINRERFTTESL